MPTWTPEQLRAYEQRRANLSARDTGPVAVVESNPRHAPLVAKEVQRPTGERFLVRIVSVRKRLLDESNLCEKYHEDLCRYAGVLPSDSPEFCHTTVSQRKTAKGESEHTIIEITKQTP